VRVLLDVNVIVSAFIVPLGVPRAIVSLWREHEIAVVSAIGIIAEVNQKLRLPRIRVKYGLNDTAIQDIIDLLRTETELVAVPPPWIGAVTGDPEDDSVLAAAALGHVDYLITGDKGLLALKEHEGVPIVSPREFLQLLQSPS
jgi:uncharacterized protein